MCGISGSTPTPADKRSLAAPPPGAAPSRHYILCERKITMSHKFRFLARRIGLAQRSVPLCLLLSACGGGGGGNSPIASIPPPPPLTPPPPAATPLTTISGYSLKGSLDVRTSWLDSPAARAGNYDLIGRLTLTPQNGGPTSYRATLPGEFTLTLDQSDRPGVQLHAERSGRNSAGGPDIGRTGQRRQLLGHQPECRVPLRQPVRRLATSSRSAPDRIRQGQ